MRQMEQNHPVRRYAAATKADRVSAVAVRSSALCPCLPAFLRRRDFSVTCACRRKEAYAWDELNRKATPPKGTMWASGCRGCGGIVATGGRRPPDTREIAAGRDNGVQVDAGLDAHAVKQIEQVFGRQIARRAGRIGAAAQRADNVAHLIWRRYTDGISYRDLVHAQRHQLARDMRHRLRRNRALIGAAERRRDVATNANARLARHLHDRAK